MTTTYLVMGQSGDHDDYRTWPVQVYDRPEEAEKHRIAAQAWCAKVESVFEAKGDIYLTGLRMSDLSNPFDANYSLSDQGATYYVKEMPPRVTNFDMSLVEDFALAPPSMEAVDRAYADLGDSVAPGNEEEDCRVTLLAQCVDPDGLIEGTPAWQVLMAKLPTKEVPPKPRVLADIWGKGIPTMPGTEGGSTD